ncbi:hypothetical protein TSUD_02850 [Trifolium subterraneum]|uniref:Uncharacterized protein n=1 Tax=Trifolium subterraneum TaxID=3900 RepID=A0A2Z6MNS7_TRISU|nr:hypothetical protein TSUD_02850 [Trifolium subterraneum]
MMQVTIYTREFCSNSTPKEEARALLAFKTRAHKNNILKYSFQRANTTIVSGKECNALTGES